MLSHVNIMLEVRRLSLNWLTYLKTHLVIWKTLHIYLIILWNQLYCMLLKFLVYLTPENATNTAVKIYFFNWHKTGWHIVIFSDKALNNKVSLGFSSYNLIQYLTIDIIISIYITHHTMTVYMFFCLPFANIYDVACPGNMPKYYPGLRDILPSPSVG
jgi:hypothetical protein